MRFAAALLTTALLSSSPVFAGYTTYFGGSKSPATNPGGPVHTLRSNSAATSQLDVVSGSKPPSVSSAFNAFLSTPGYTFQVENFEGLTQTSTYTVAPGGASASLSANPASALPNTPGGAQAISTTLMGSTAHIYDQTRGDTATSIIASEYTGAAGRSVTGRYPTSGDNFLSTRAASGQAASVSISFDQSVAAVGFFLTDVFDEGSIEIIITKNDSTTEVFTYGAGGNTYNNIRITGGSGAHNGSIVFFGYITDDDQQTIKHIQIRSLNTSDNFGFDDLYVGLNPAAVPEPGSIALALCGLAGLPFLRRRAK